MRLGTRTETGLFLVTDACFVVMLWVPPHSPTQLTLAWAGFLTGTLVAILGSRPVVRLCCGVFAAVCLMSGLAGLVASRG